MGYYNEAYGNVGNAPTTAVAAGVALKHVADHADQTKLQANNAAMHQLSDEIKFNEEGKTFMSDLDSVKPQSDRAMRANEDYNNAYLEHSRLDAMEEEITSEHSREKWEKAMSAAGRELDEKRWQKEYYDNYMSDIRAQAAQLDLKGELLNKNNKIIKGQIKTKGNLGTYTGKTFGSQLEDKVREGNK